MSASVGTAPRSRSSARTPMPRFCRRMASTVAFPRSPYVPNKPGRMFAIVISEDMTEPLPQILERAVVRYDVDDGPREVVEHFVDVRCPLVRDARVGETNREIGRAVA